MRKNAKKLIAVILLNFIICSSLCADSLSYSGRLVNANGSPVSGLVKLKFELAYTNNLTIILCSQSMTGVSLVNGVFHVKLDFNCPSSSLKKVLEEIPTNNSIAIRVIDETPSVPKVYSFQALHSIPSSILSSYSKQLVQMGAISGQVLTWDGSRWSPSTPNGTGTGTVTQIIAGDGLSGGTITNTGIISIADGGVTSGKLHQMGASTGQVLKWNGSAWVPSVDLDTNTGISSEADPLIRKFARNDITGLTPQTCGANQTLQYVLMNDTLECFDIVKNALLDGELNLAPSQNAVFDALAAKQNSITVTTDLTLKTIRLMTDGTYWVGLKAPTASTANLLFTLPTADGTAGQLLKTDGSGNLSWVDAGGPGTITGVTTSAPLIGSGNSGSVNLTLSYDNTSIGLNGSNSLTVKNGGISNAHINASASIDWSKINKIGASASDVGAVPTARAINTSTATGLLGGGDLTSDRTLSIDVGTSAGKIVQIDSAGKLPAIDGSQLTNLGSDWGKWTNAVGGIHFSSGNVGIGTSTPSASLDVGGSIHALEICDETGSNCKDISTGWGASAGSGLGSWESRAFSTNYQAATDGFVVAWGSTAYLVGYTDSTPTPTIKRVESEGATTSAARPSIILPVKKDDYWRVQLASGSAGGIFWIPLAGPDSGIWSLNGTDTYKSSGNIGIGTITPGSKLDVKGTIRLSGATSGYVGLAPAAVAGSTTYTLPSADGTNGQILQTNGSGVLSWTTNGSAPSGPAGGDLTGTYPNPSISGLDAAKIATGTVSNAEFGFLNGVPTAAGTVSQFLRGDKSWQSLNTLTVPRYLNSFA